MAGFSSRLLLRPSVCVAHCERHLEMVLQLPCFLPSPLPAYDVGVAPAHLWMIWSHTCASFRVARECIFLREAASLNLSWAEIEAPNESAVPSECTVGMWVSMGVARVCVAWLLWRFNPRLWPKRCFCLCTYSLMFWQKRAAMLASKRKQVYSCAKGVWDMFLLIDDH